jgi:hypothetical protein
MNRPTPPELAARELLNRRPFTINVTRRVVRPTPDGPVETGRMTRRVTLLRSKVVEDVRSGTVETFIGE